MSSSLAQTAHSRRGVALIMVVTVLAGMLVIGTAFMHQMRLDHQAAVNYGRTGQAELFALDGLHRAMSELMYDVWGVAEDRAFACSPEWGQLSRGISVDATEMIAAYALDGEASKQIVAHSAVKRRSVCDTGVATEPQVQTDFRWVYKDRYGASGAPDPDASHEGTQYGGCYLDEFLPEHTDNGDLFELGLHYNHGKATGRRCMYDAVAELISGSWWYGEFWPAAGGGDHPPFDYVDTRISVDSFYHIFRFDLVSPDDHAVHCTGLRNQDPLQPIGKEDAYFGATHLDFVPPIDFWPDGDTWGGALNLNQVNNNYRWEIYHNIWDYESIPAGTIHHYRESKWINVYDVGGHHKIGRYAVMVMPDAAMPNANYLYDGLAGYEGSRDTHMKYPARYLQAVDKGVIPHGWSLTHSPVDSEGGGGSFVYLDMVKAYQPRHTYPNCQNWAQHVSTRANEHIREHGMLTTRSELAVLLRKDSFSDDLEDDVLSSDAHLLTSLLTCAGYEYLLGPHWEVDRMVIDAARSAADPESAHGLFLSGGTRRLLAQYLQQLKYYWGPDQRIPHPPPSLDSFDWATEEKYHHTPFHEPEGGDPNPDAFVGPMVSNVKLAERAHRAKLSVLAWLMGATADTRDTERGTCFGDRVNLVCVSDGTNYAYELGASYAAHTGGFHNSMAEVQLPCLHRIVQVGRVQPRHPTQAENRNTTDNGFPVPGGPPGFDAPEMSGAYSYVTLIQSGGWYASDFRVPMTKSGDWRQSKLYVGGREILQDTSLKDRVFMLYTNPTLSGDTTERIWNSEQTPWLAAWEAAGDVGPASTESGGWPAFTWEVTRRGGEGGGSWYANKNNRRDTSAKLCHLYEHPSRYITVLWKDSDTDPIDGDEVFYVGGGNVIDYVRLPERVGKLPAGEAWSAFDFFNNSVPSCWQRTDATYPWRNYYTNWREDIFGYDQWNTWGDWAMSKLWAGGRSPNSIWNMWPEYRRDYHNNQRGAGWHSAHAALEGEKYDNKATIFSTLTDLRRCPVPFMPPLAGNYSDPNARFGSYGLIDQLKARPRLFENSAPVRYVKAGDPPGEVNGAYNPYNPYNPMIAPAARSLYLHYVYDPDIRIWYDLSRVAPLEQYFITGYLIDITSTWNQDTARPPLNQTWYYPIFDGYDNDLDGIIDELVEDELNPAAVAPGGHYMGDRRSIARVNLNALNHPVGIYYLEGTHNNTNRGQMLIAGRKPLYGYTSQYEVVTRHSFCIGLWGWNWCAPSPYFTWFWYDNQYADITLDSVPHDQAQSLFETALAWTDTMSYTGPSPVHTVYITAQTVSEDLDDPDITMPTSEVKIRATVERTWDGKMNMLEFTWIPQDVW